jgi:predicted RNase H-like HicB family nuclease
VGRHDDLLTRILRGTSDASIPFTELRNLLHRLGFAERIRGSHHIVQEASMSKSEPRYEMIIYWSEEDQAFIAEVPELPGCAADGRTYKEAVSNAEVVIQEWIETAQELGRPIPQPKGRLLYA